MNKKQDQKISQSQDIITKFPQTRFMGSKRKLLAFIANTVKDIKYDTVLDAFSGSGSVSYLFKSLGKKVTSNDFLAYSYNITKATVENNTEKLSEADLASLLKKNTRAKEFIQETFNGLYFTPEDNDFLDNVSANIALLKNDYKKTLALASLGRAALKKQPRGVFTVIGNRYDDGRLDLRLSMREQFIKSVNDFNDSIFDNNRSNKALKGNIFNVNTDDFDLIYFDPPYYSQRSDNDYIRRYHFIEGLATYWKDDKIIADSKTKRIEKRETPFSSRVRCYEAFDQLFSKFQKGIFLVSYSSNSLPTKEEMVKIMKKHRSNIKVFEHDHKYSFGNQSHRVGSNQNCVKEYLFLGY
ncbi:MAG: DNA adenine methylase [Patescibacteria group bacterium]|nr:DNA adenine methylase [Patescibacteria group bacterium]